MKVDQSRRPPLLLQGLRWSHALVAAVLVSACASAPRRAAAQNPPAGQSASADSLDPSLVPAGFGSLRQDDITLRVSLTGGLTVKALPLDERIIRLLSPDSYASLSAIVASKQRDVKAVKDRSGLPNVALWYVTFYALEQGETRFSPQEFVISNVGRDLRPIEVIPLTPGFGEYRLKQRQLAAALYVFDGQIDTNQPIAVQMEGTQSNSDWSSIRQRLDNERALVRSRAAAKKSPATPGPVLQQPSRQP